jgi:hypothetical protein
MRPFWPRNVYTDPFSWEGHMTKTRLSLCLACVGLIGVAFASACGSSNSSPGNGDSGPDSTAAENEAGGEDATPDTTTQPPPKDASPGTDTGTKADGATDGGLADAHSDSATTDTGTSDTGSADTGSGDSSSSDAGSGDTGISDAGSTDAAGDTGTTDAASDSPSDAGGDGPILIGPACHAADGGNTACPFGDHCCVTTATQAATCAASCNADAGSFAVDCVGSSGQLQCGQVPGATQCCATLVLVGGTAPNCGASELQSTCAPSCGVENPPATTCDMSHNIHLCTATVDCAGDTPDGGISRTHCCAFGANPLAWCTSDLLSMSDAAACTP